MVVGGRSSVCGLRASDGDVWCWLCWGLVGGGGDIVVCLARRPVLRCSGWACRPSLGVRLRGGLLVGARCFGVVFVIEEVGCELFVCFTTYVTLVLSVFCRVSNDALPMVATLSVVGL